MYSAIVNARYKHGLNLFFYNTICNIITLHIVCKKPVITPHLLTFRAVITNNKRQ
jgi:hypothetical protein